LAQRLLRPLLPVTKFARRYPSIPGRVHLADGMLESESPERLQHYLDDGLSAMENIEESLRLVGRTFADVTSCLDLPSGYGRVTRHLSARIEPARITAADVDRVAVRFCAREFGVRALAVPRHPERLRLPQRYDLVFVGSLLTHLQPDSCLVLVEALTKALAPGALLIFSTQGETCLDHLEWYGDDFRAAEATYRADVGRTGVCFRPYRWRRHYGITIHARSYVEHVVAGPLGRYLELVRFKERGWDAHQDVWSCCRRPS
jgi:SAM-dependent methyltransferase